MNRIIKKLQDYRYKKRLSRLLFTTIISLRHETIMLIINSIRTNSILPSKEIKINGRLIDKYTIKHRSIKGY